MRTSPAWSLLYSAKWRGLTASKSRLGLFDLGQKDVAVMAALPQY